MPRHITQNPPGTRVVVYLRRSSKGSTRQQASIEDQRSDVTDHCAEAGLEVARWYEDDGSGLTGGDKRKAFGQMMSDAGSPDRTWAGIVLWHSSRWGRRHSFADQDSAKLHKLGIWVETLNRGRYDFDDGDDRLSWLGEGEKNNASSRDLSTVTRRGRRQQIKRGYWGSGRVPWGYDRQYLRDGQEPVVILRNVVGGRPAGYSLKPTINEEERPEVIRLFDQVIAGKSLRSIASDLNARGVAAPGGGAKGWTWSTVDSVVRCPAYYGVSGGPRGKRSPKPKFGELGTEIVNAAGCPPIIDRAIWDAAQRRLGSHRYQSTKRHQSGVLSGMCRCGHCGLSLKKQVRYSRVCSSCGSSVPRLSPSGLCMSCGEPVGDRKDPVVVYYCPARSTYAGSAKVCRGHVVAEKAMLDLVRQHLLGQIEDQVLAKLSDEPTTAADDTLAALRTSVEKLRGDVKKATARALLMDGFAAEQANAMIAEWSGDLTAAQAALHAAEQARDPAVRRQMKAWVDQVRADWVSFEPYMRPATESDVAGLEMLGVTADTYSTMGMKGTFEPRLDARRDALGGLLHRLGLGLHVHWKPNGKLETPDQLRIVSRFQVESDQTLSISDGAVVCQMMR